MHKKRPKICTCCRVSKAKFYLYHSNKIAKARPGFDNRPVHPSVQINSSSPWISLNLSFIPLVEIMEAALVGASLRPLRLTLRPLRPPGKRGQFFRSSNKR